MKIIVDTPVWSQALRRRSNPDNPTVNVLRQLISESRVIMLGCIRQEMLSDLRSDQQFQILRNQLRAFPDKIMRTADYEKAAEFFNLCRQKGIQGSNTDFLICAAATNRGHAILTTDNDFRTFQRVIQVTPF